MKTKKYVIAIAIFGGMLFTAQATNLFQANEDAPKIERRAYPIPSHG
ncbi:hypothetical protein [Xanthomarina spongicola]|uniref:Uncharacterized protein n=1 Tax=Xanthomarina spongicola TaxID=570520 RepID=A0A316DR69_9FLAO|nr:hypothetical protein [Xanthomarina spongicola]PWK19952.1 hypothetical protein LX78_01302 [Xanthomarina spongicola]